MGKSGQTFLTFIAAGIYKAQKLQSFQHHIRFAYLFINMIKLRKNMFECKLGSYEKGGRIAEKLLGNAFEVYPRFGNAAVYDGLCLFNVYHNGKTSVFAVGNA